MPDNPFVNANDLLSRLDDLKRDDKSDFASHKAILKVLRHFPSFDVLRLLRGIDLREPGGLARCGQIAGSEEQAGTTIHHAVAGAPNKTQLRESDDPCSQMLEQVVADLGIVQ